MDLEFIEYMSKEERDFRSSFLKELDKLLDNHLFELASPSNLTKIELEISAFVINYFETYAQQDVTYILNFDTKFEDQLIKIIPVNFETALVFNGIKLEANKFKEHRTVYDTGYGIFYWINKQISFSTYKESSKVKIPGDFLNDLIEAASDIANDQSKNNPIGQTKVISRKDERIKFLERENRNLQDQLNHKDQIIEELANLWLGTLSGDNDQTVFDGCDSMMLVNDVDGAIEYLNDVVGLQVEERKTYKVKK